MSEKLQIQMTQRGIVTIPQSIRDRYNLKPGDLFSLIDLDGVFVLSPHRSQIDRLANEVAGALSEKGETLESMIKELRRQRERYGKSERRSRISRR